MRSGLPLPANVHLGYSKVATPCDPRPHVRQADVALGKRTRDFFCSTTCPAAIQSLPKTLAHAPSEGEDGGYLKMSYPRNICYTGEAKK